MKKPALSLLSLLDMFLRLASPLAVITFLVMLIVALDALGTHVQFLRALEQRGALAQGRLQGYTPGERLAYVAFDAPQNGLDGVLLDTRYYPRSVLAGLHEGQVLRVRYTRPPQDEAKGILEEQYPRVRAWGGWLGASFWPLLLSWLVLVIHPECLYLGLELDTGGKNPPGGRT